VALPYLLGKAFGNDTADCCTARLFRNRLPVRDCYNRDHRKGRFAGKRGRSNQSGI